MVEPLPTPQRTPAEDVTILGVDPDEGLSDAEVERRRAEYGPNVLAGRREAALWRRILRPLSDPMVLLLLMAGTVFLALGERRDAIVMLVAIIPVVLVDAALEGRAERTLERLRELAAPKVQVRRAGHVERIPSEDLGPGDVVLLREGDVVPADGVVVSGADLQLDESPLTGESLPISKVPTGWPAPLEALTDPQHLLFAGTSLLSGRATMVVATTGRRTKYGRIGTLLAEIVPQPSPLQSSIAHLNRVLAIAALGVSVGVAGIQLLRGLGPSRAVLAGVSLAIAAIPEEFAIVFTLYLTLGAWRMARQNALIRKLAGVETLGSTTVICADKTGTLTEGQLTLAALYADRHILSGRPDRLSPAFATLLEDAVLASESPPYDPLDRAIDGYARQVGVEPEGLYRRWQLVFEYPFDPRRKYVTHVWRSTDGRLRLAAKGAVEAILDLASSPESTRDAALEANAQLARRGMRVLGVAEKGLTRLSGQRWADERGLRFVGLLGFADPPRSGVRAAVDACQGAGVRVIMITGDHPQTAHAVAEAVGLRHHDDEVLTGEDLARLDDAELQRRLEDVAIFARIEPTQKYRIVRAFQAQGQVVAMTGDGINDAPALRAADIGVAMGRRGTEVAREAATMVLLDDNFSTIVSAIREGRRIFDNLRRAFDYLIGFHLPIVALALVAPLFGMPLLLLPVHLVWLEVIIHPTSALVFQAEEPSPDLMRRPPRSPHEPFLRLKGATTVVAEGVAIAVGVLGLFLWASSVGRSTEGARALALAALFLAQTVLVLQVRSPHQPIWRRGLAGNWALAPVLTATLLSLLLIVYVPPLAQAAYLGPLSLLDWLLAALVAIATTLVFDLSKLC